MASMRDNHRSTRSNKRIVDIHIVVDESYSTCATNEYSMSTQSQLYSYSRRRGGSKFQSRHRSNKYNRNSRSRSMRRSYLILGIFILLIHFASLVSVCHAEEDGSGDGASGDEADEADDGNNSNDASAGDDFQGDDFYEIEDDNFYTPKPTTAPPSPNPTPSPTAPPTKYPTKFPTEEPTAYPTMEPTRAGDDFYEVQIDDYTAEAQSAEIYISSISDVVLCLLCTFFWVLWLVGTIFPTKLQHLYKTEGIVVVGDVIESYVTHGEGAPVTNEGHEDTSEMNGGDTFDALNNLPTYHAIVSYVVPGPIASGRRRKRKAGANRGAGKAGSPNQSPANKYHLQEESEQVRKAQNTPTAVTDHALEELSQKLSLDHVRASIQAAKGTPPRPPRSSPRLSKRSNSFSPESPGPQLRDFDGIRNRQLSKISEEMMTNKNNQKSLLDACTTKSFDTTSIVGKKLVSRQKDEADLLGFYKYNRNDSSDYTSHVSNGNGNNDEWDDEYENPELIGNLFHSFGLAGMVINKEKTIVKKSAPVRVKKRFETNEILLRGTKNVEIIVLPGNPGSGILKNEFEMEEDYMLHGTLSEEPESIDKANDDQNEGKSTQMGDGTAAMIGVILAAVSVIGAVHGALTLPYRRRACKFDLAFVLS
jgi:hypothetical protein